MQNVVQAQDGLKGEYILRLLVYSVSIILNGSHCRTILILLVSIASFCASLLMLI